MGLELDEAAQSWWGLFRNELGWTEGTVFQIEDNQIVLSTREHPQHRCDHPGSSNSRTHQGKYHFEEKKAPQAKILGKHTSNGSETLFGTST